MKRLYMVLLALAALSSLFDCISTQAALASGFVETSVYGNTVFSYVSWFLLWAALSCGFQRLGRRWFGFLGFFVLWPAFAPAVNNTLLLILF